MQLDALKIRLTCVILPFVYLFLKHYTLSHRTQVHQHVLITTQSSDQGLVASYLGGSILLKV